MGLVTNPTGVTNGLESTIDALHRCSKVNLRAVFGPEHGARGDAQDALKVSGHVDAYTGLPVHSLYGDHEKPTVEMLEGLEALVFDIQDCGARFYTYVSTLTHCMEASAEHGIRVVVLDRPNPLNGDATEGNILKPGFRSFIGLHPVPIRHGLTVGELAQFINQGIQCDLHVVEMEGWRRGMWYDETSLPWIQPSPNLPSLDTATVYPGTCFFEGVNVSEGRGTTRPFEYIGAPWIDGRSWAETLNNTGLPGVCFRSSHFTPTFWKFKDERCGGVQVHVVDRKCFRPMETGLHLLTTLIQLYPDTFSFNESSYDKRRHFDLLAGTDTLRADLMAGVSVEEIMASWMPELEEYREKRKEHLLYGGDDE
ncbi:MAG: DUF1343 domain-containing protein [Candidatus Bathyarchaeota archaeon]|nr:DUF1343 domain-containing protein [Candidatus Bathyarchaeota archaeon]